MKIYDCFGSVLTYGSIFIYDHDSEKRQLFHTGFYRNLNIVRFIISLNLKSRLFDGAIFAIELDNRQYICFSFV